MADLPFWQQLLLSGAQGLVAAGVVVVAGWKYFRQQERIRREEDALGDLAKLRQDAMVKVLRTIGDQVLARLTYGAVAEMKDENSKSAALAAAAAGVQVANEIMAHLFLLPKDFGDAAQACSAALTRARNVDEINAATALLAQVIDPYLPALPQPSLASRGPSEN